MHAVDAQMSPEAPGLDVTRRFIMQTCEHSCNGQWYHETSTRINVRHPWSACGWAWTNIRRGVKGHRMHFSVKGETAVKVVICATGRAPSELTCRVHLWLQHLRHAGTQISPEWRKQNPAHKRTRWRSAEAVVVKLLNATRLSDVQDDDKKVRWQQVPMERNLRIDLVWNLWYVI